MVAFKDRTGDFTNKKHLYKFYKNGYTSKKPKYITAGQYMGSTGTIVDGNISDRASLDGNFFENSANIFGSGDPNSGLSATYRVESDARRKIDIEGLIMSFAHGWFGSTGTVPTYEVQIFDYILRYTNSGNTLKVFYKTTELASVTMAAGYTYIRFRELNGTFYVDRSSDGITWTNWTSRLINKTTDILRSTLSIQARLGIGGVGNAGANINSIEAVDRHGNLLAVETEVLSDLEFETSINNPASATTVVLPYSPLNVPKHCDQGNFVEIYTNFYDDGVIDYEGLLDHNSLPILDHNDQPIEGVVLNGNVPEKSSIQKFSGFIDNIDYDYDNETITLNLTSHGEQMANSIVRDGNTSIPVISQLLQDGDNQTFERRQTFTLTKMTKLDAVEVRIKHGAGGAAWVNIGRGNDVLMSSNVKTWSGLLPEQNAKFDMPKPLYLEAGTYWLAVSGNITWRAVLGSRPYTGGYRQWVVEGSWQNLESSAYFVLYTTQLQTAVNLSGKSGAIAKSIFDKSLSLDYSPLYLGEVQEAGYDINIGLNLDTAKNAVAALYRQLPTGWFYRVDVGTNEVTIKNQNATPDHLLVFGRDFTEMRVSKDIQSIINDVYYIGASLVENGPKLTVRSTDTNSIDEYRQGLSIQSNDKVSRYDTAQLLSQNIINNNNTPRLTTEITLSAAVYNIETLQSGDVVKIVNGDKDVLAANLVIATVRYSRGGQSATISLDSAPRNLSRTIDAINRQLENIQTAGAGAVV